MCFSRDVSLTYRENKERMRLNDGVRQSRLICLGNEFEDGSRTPFFRPAILERFIIYAREGILEGSSIF